MEIKTFFDARTYTLTYVVYDSESLDAVVIDPVLDYDPKASKTWTESVDLVIEFVKAQGLKLHYILETHAHADHLSGSQMLKEAFPQAKTAIGNRIVDVQTLFKGIFDLPSDFPTDGRQFDQLLADEDTFEAGAFSIKTIHTPGHTPACVTYQINDALFTGDTLFMPDMGTGRCDFPGGSAEDMYHSIIDRLYSLPNSTRIFVGHDYMPGGRELSWETTVGEEKEHNVQLPIKRSKEEYLKFRQDRDAILEAPRLLFQSVQVNIDAGSLPDPRDNQIRYLRIPVNVFRPEPAGELEVQDV